MTPCVVVDTNVAVVAGARRSPQASRQCVLSCINRLRRVRDSGGLALDDQWQIIREYMKQLRPEGQPDVGGEFLKWVLQNWTNTRWCSLVAITPVEGDRGFAEFPDDPALAAFDRSDRKFVATALACHPPAVIVEAVDLDFWLARAALSRNGVVVDFLCQDDMPATGH